MNLEKQTTTLDVLMNEKNRMNKQITMSVELIIPDMARNFLMANLNDKTIKNRKIHTRTVNAYVDDMLNDRWKVSSPILFDTQGRMIDGQTRCTAIVKANKAIIALVIRGLDVECFKSLDCGKKRTHKNVLETLISLDGRVLMKPASVSAGINLMNSVAQNHKVIEKSRGLLTNTQIFDMVKNDFDYYNDPFQSGNMGTWRKNINMAINETILTAFYYTNKNGHGKLIDDFMKTITSNNTTTPPIVREFRDMMIENKGRKSDERGYLTPKQVYGLIQTLFNYNQSKGLMNRKHFSKTDLDSIFIN